MWKCCLPLLEALLVLALLTVSNCYMITYTDCLDPESVDQADADSLCTTSTDQHVPEATMTLLQQAETVKVSGFSCQVTRSRWVFYCGSFSHFKLAESPQIDHTLTVSVPWCQQMILTGKFKPGDFNSVSEVKIGEETIIALTVVGEIETSNTNIACTGERRKVGGKILDNMLELHEYKVTLRPEEFLIKGDKIESVSDHLLLPCSSNDHGCITGTSTYFWNQPSGCSLEVIRDFTPTKVMHTYLLDWDKRILLNVTGSVASPMGCGDLDLKKTNYPGIFVTPVGTTQNLKQIEPEDINILFHLDMREDFLMFALEQKIEETTSQWKVEICQQHKRELYSSPQKLSDGRYGWLRGDTLYIIKCASKTSPVAEKDTCFDAIPVSSDVPTFVDPITRLRIPHAAVVPCNTRYPLKIKLQQDIWISLTPHISPVPAPQGTIPKLNEETGDKHISMHKGGLYTMKEQESWRQLSSFPSYHVALLRSITTGACLHEGTCSASVNDGIQRFDLSQLNPRLEDYTFWGKIDSWIRIHGDYLALVVIIIIILRILITVGILFFTWLKEGVAATLATLFLICCGSAAAMNKVRRRNRRRNVEEPIVELPRNAQLIEQRNLLPPLLPLGRISTASQD